MGISLTKPKMEVLSSLHEKPTHGYELAETIGLHESTVYGHLSELEEEGYIEGEEEERRIVYHLTDKGELIVEATD
jgi:DNA-binding PadR family transcriptional regulator